MKKKIILASSFILSVAIMVTAIACLKGSNLSVNAQFGESESHQIIFRAEDASLESESTWTNYFKLHKDNATLSGYSIDSTPNECLIMADSIVTTGGDWICTGEANPASGTYASLVVTIPLTNIESFSGAVLRGKFYRDYWSDLVTEIHFGSERFFTKEFYVHLSHEYREIFLEEIELNYTCAI